MATTFTFFLRPETKQGAFLSGVNNGLAAGQSFGIINEGTEDKVLGTVQTVQSVTDFAKSSKLGTDISNVLISGLSMGKLDVNSLNSFAGWIAVTVVLKNQAVGGDLTNATAADALTVLGALGTTFGAALASPALLVVAGISTVTGIVYTLVQGRGGEQWTIDKFLYGYEKTIMEGFINDLWTREDKQLYTKSLRSQGGAQTLKWMIAALENQNLLTTEMELLNKITPTNYRNQALDYIYGDDEERYGHIRDRSATAFDTINKKYYFDFIDKDPEELLSFLKNNADNQNLINAYLNALKNINPVVAMNPDKFNYEKILLDDVSDDWIKARTWAIMEMRTKLGQKYYKDIKESDAKDLEENPDIYNLPQSEDYFKQHIANTLRVRSSYGLNQNDRIIFVDEVNNFEFSNKDEGVPHRVVFIDLVYTDLDGKTNGDILIGNGKNNTITGGDGNDTIIGGDGHDWLKTGGGFDHLNGGDGNDHYDFSDLNNMRGIITDSDGQGKITLFGKLLSKAVQFEQVAPGSDVWQGEYQGEILRAVLDPKGNLHITGSTSKADLLIEGWRDMGHDKLGIILGEFNDKAPGDGYTLIEGDWRTRIIGVEVDRGITDNRQ